MIDEHATGTPAPELEAHRLRLALHRQALHAGDPDAFAVLLGAAIAGDNEAHAAVLEIVRAPRRGDA